MDIGHERAYTISNNERSTLKNRKGCVPIMKKLLALLLAAAMALSVTGAWALNYQQLFDGESTFETLEEARVNEIQFLKDNVNPDTDFVPDPCLDAYPEGTTWIYRTGKMFHSGSAGVRMNTNILVYTDAEFETKEDAKKYLEDLGLIDIIEEVMGSIVLVVPETVVTTGSSGGVSRNWGANDQYSYYLLQSAMCNVNFSTYADSRYYGGLTNRYFIGIDGGATFFNNYIAPNMDYVSRLAGVLLVGGAMETIRTIADRVPAYLVNPTAVAVEKYKAANQANACGYLGDKAMYFNQERPLQKVLVLEEEAPDMKAVVADAWYNMLCKTMRNAVVQSGLYTASTLYSNYNFNQAPYSLSPRNAIFNGKTADGLNIIEHRENRFDYIKTDSGEYIDVWWEILPDEVLDGTAKDGTIPLLLANHGGGDDPIQFLDEIGWLNVAGDERIAIIAPRHQEAYAKGIEILPEMVKYMLETYPALDASRVYVTGYSYGGNETYKAIKQGTALFAAMAPMGSTSDASEDWTPDDASLELPYMITTATQDFAAFNTAEGRINDNCVGCVQKMLGINNMPEVEIDFEKYPISGFKADEYFQTVYNGEYTNHTWWLKNEAGVPMVGVSVTEYLPHGLYQEYARAGWDWLKHFSRNQETLAIEYDPYAK